MSGTIDLFDYQEERTIQDRFWEFHRNNPHVYTELVKLTRQLVARGFTKVGMRMLWEVLRWNTMMKTIHLEGDYKLNDIYFSRYARLIMEQEPDLAGIYETRRLRKP